MAKHRLNLDLSSEELHDLVETVRLEGPHSNQANVVRRALRLLKIVLKLRAEGGKIIFEKADGSKETLIVL